MFVDGTLADLIMRSAALTALAVLWVIGLVRLVGLRSFSKMTSFDFITTVASGSLLAGAAQASTWTVFGQAIFALTAIFVVQWTIARIRKGSDAFEHAIQNKPILLMRDGVIDDRALERTRVARSDLIAKLREANVLRFSAVRAVVLETTGDIAVLHGDELEDDLLDGVRTARS
ncbi:MAG: YetF domain-containing protein [Parvularcula sp.]|jgi:uncharacterized membrane protein YcaP (DUF421 family)|nr:YetF domain-containing protein [Parvularcula sp.]